MSQILQQLKTRIDERVDETTKSIERLTAELNVLLSIKSDIDDLTEDKAG